MPEPRVRVWHNPNFESNAPRSGGNAAPRKPRQWNEKGFIPFRLEVLTPVHIGSGETLSPLEYVLRQKDGEWRLYRLDMRAWFAESSDDAAVRGAIESDDLKRIQKTVDEKTGPTAEDAERLALFSCRIPDETLVEDLRRVLERQSGKKGEVDAIMRNPADGSVCLPGSSLKGALSTPLINRQDLQKSGDRGGFLKGALDPSFKPRDQQREYHERMKRMFGDIRIHAMQALKVSDVLIAPDVCHIVQAEEKARKADKTPTPKNACEAIPAGAMLYGRLLFDSASGEPQIQGPDWTADFGQLRELCNAFYLGRLAVEYGKFYTLPHWGEVRGEMDQVLKKIAAGFGLEEQQVKVMVQDALQQWKPDSGPREVATLIQTKLQALGSENPPLLLRVGHYSHVECMTVDANAPKGRSFKDKEGNMTDPVFGTTRTLAAGKQPFGWVLLHFCTPEEYADGILQIETDVENAALERRELAREAAKRNTAKALEAERIHREAEERRIVEESKRQDEEARLAAMSPEEREIDTVASLRATENEAVALYSKLDGLDGALQGKAARALRTFWDKAGKWQGKGLTKKQTEKVNKVKALLAKEEP